MEKKIALIGAGYWGKNLFRDLNNLGVLKTVCELDDNIINNLKKNNPTLNVTKSWNSVLEDQDISAVVIALPAENHYKFAKEALLSDKDVFVEKPLSLDLKEAEHLVKIADDKKKILMVGHVLQYHPCIQKMKDILSSGELGSLYYINSSRKNLGKIRQQENVLWSFAPHDISIILSLVNHSKPLSIKCVGQKHLHPDIHDVTDTFIQFPGNCFAHIGVNWLYPHKEQKISIVCSEGMIVFDDMKPKGEKLSICKKYLNHEPGSIPTVNNQYFYPVTVDWDEEKLPLQLECEHFIDCCLTREIPLTDGKEGLAVLRVLDECHKQLTSIKNETKTSTKYFSHETAIVDSEATIGDGTKIWHHSHVMRATLGKNCSLGQNCFVANDVSLGNNCKVQNNVSIYSGVVCEDNVFLGPSMVFCNDINPRANFSKNGKYLKTLVKTGASIGANATILPGITLGEHCFIGAGAVVTKDVEPHAVMVGNPAKKISLMDEKGEIQYKI